MQRLVIPRPAHGGDLQQGLKELLQVGALLWVAVLIHDLHSHCADLSKKQWRLQCLCCVVLQ